MSIAFETPPGLRFTCTQCGDCCRAWNVALGPGEAQRIGALDWRGRAEHLAGAPVTAPFGAARRLARRDDGACVFLGERNQCLIHENFGEEAKPLLCRMYPFAFHPLAGRVGIDASFYCRAVSHDHGQPIEHQTPEWAKLLAEADVRGEKTKYTIDGKRPLSGEVLWEFEFLLVQFLREATLPLLDRVRCCLKFLELATTGDPNKESSRPFRDAIAEGIPAQVRRHPPEGTLNETQRVFFQQELFLALNPAPMGFEALSIAEKAHEKQRRLAAGERFRAQQGNPWIDNREAAADFEAIARVKAGALSSAADEYLARFLAAKIIGQKFLAQGDATLPLIDGGVRLMLTYPMIAWTARALAAQRRIGAVEVADVRQATRLIDRTYGQPLGGELTKEQRQAVRFVLLETDLVVAAARETLS